MNNKIFSLASAGLMFLGTAGPALAYYPHSAIQIKNKAYSSADTGNNYQGNSVELKKVGVGSVLGGGNNSMTTGEANSTAKAKTEVNATLNLEVEEEEGKVPSVAKIYNKASSSSNTGNNYQGNSAYVKKSSAGLIDVGGNNTITTGNANSTAEATTTVNVTVNQSD